MRLRIIAEKKEPFFSYVEMAKDMWRKKIQDEQKKVNISFDLENDYDVKRREIVIDQTQWDHTKCKFKCELYSAGGDWQSPVYYFRCQIVDGYAKNLSPYGNSHFVYIPGKDAGNPHLIKTKKGWSAPDSDAKEEGDENKAWKSLKAYLKKLVDEEIAEVRKNGL